MELYKVRCGIKHFEIEIDRLENSHLVQYQSFQFQCKISGNSNTNIYYKCYHYQNKQL